METKHSEQCSIYPQLSMYSACIFYSLFWSGDMQPPVKPKLPGVNRGVSSCSSLGWPHLHLGPRIPDDI